MNQLVAVLLTVLPLFSMACCPSYGSQMLVGQNEASCRKKIPVIFDTDTNNELDDQHALAYLLFNGDHFDVRGVTVHATYLGGDVEEHMAEANRVMLMCNASKTIPLVKGANGGFMEEEEWNEAAKFILKQATAVREGTKLVVLAVGKLTNVAVALKSNPKAASKIRLVWLGSNYPEAGEYNLVNDVAAADFLLKMPDLEFEIVTVRYGRQTGSDVVRITKEEVATKMTGLGVQVEEAVEGRNGGKFKCFGDYSVDLFTNLEYFGNQTSRALYDMVAVAVVKNPMWGKKVAVACPAVVGKEGVWMDSKSDCGDRRIVVWEDFDKEAIIEDFFFTCKEFVLANNDCGLADK